MILLLSYDLNQHESPDEYQRLIKAIKDTAGEGNYVKALYSQWFVESNLSITDWNATMRNATDDNDNRMIVELTKRPTGKYFSSAIDWLKQRL